MVTLTPEATNTMRAHAERTFPEECVGAVLLDGTVVPLENVAANRRSGFALSARDCVAAEEQGVLGYYHSHPDGPAEPSSRDEAQAPPDRWMFIIRVVAGVAQAPRAFHFDAGFGETVHPERSRGATPGACGRTRP